MTITKGVTMRGIFKKPAVQYFFDFEEKFPANNFRR